MIALRKTVVLDSNLVVSAFLRPHGAAAQALEIAFGHFDVACSRETINELLDVLKRDKFDNYLSKSERLERLEAYIQGVILVDVSLSVDDCLDPKDNKFLALAIATKSVALVSGDKRDLISMHPYRGIAIVGVRDFIERVERYL